MKNHKDIPEERTKEWNGGAERGIEVAPVSEDGLPHMPVGLPGCWGRGEFEIVSDGERFPVTFLHESTTWIVT